MKPYNHKTIEKKWQKIWAKKKIYKTESESKKEKFYILDMFPYPSGEGLHVGHPKGYIATDVISRMNRMKGKNVLHPMGFDAFGLPAENYAIKTKTNPEVAVKKNVARYKEQLEILGFDYDWSREINTTDPAYYKWTQWIFLKLLEKGLAYESYEPINWCPFDKTGLANEDVENGKCERCGTPVEKKPMRQWVLRITDYADRMLEDLKLLDWPESIKESQRSWIGRSEGSLLKFEIRSISCLRTDPSFGGKSETRPNVPFRNGQANSKSKILNEENGKIEVFTTRADTLFGVTYLVVAPEYGWLQQEIRSTKSEIRNKEEIEKYINEVKMKTEIERTGAGKEKTGVEIKGIKAINPANNEEIPIWVADYVLADYGTGAVMAVPAHDERDFEFAKKYSLPILKVVTPVILQSIPADYHGRAGNRDILIISDTNCFPYEGVLINSKKFDGLSSEEAKKKITEAVGGKIVTKYKLKDWVFSRQRYWGEPIPVIHCETCALSNPAGRGIVPVPEKDLPVKLPKVKSYEPTGTGESPLAGVSKWVNVKCPHCGGKAKRETNTMPQWAGSSWYYLAYISKKAKSPPERNASVRAGYNLKAKSSLDNWLPVDFYVGGAEHATRHLIYARFWHKFLQDIGVVSTPEPFKKLQSVGLIMGEDGRKMSKRFGNVVNPDTIVETVGADTLRVYEMFMGPFDQAISWNMQSIAGARRFLERVWGVQGKLQATNPKKQINNKSQIPNGENGELEILINQTIKKVGEDIGMMKFNTAISSLMVLLNTYEKEDSLSQKDYEILLKLLAPFAPHITDELWLNLGNKESIHISKWPEFDPRKVVNLTTTVVVQINGKVRAEFEINDKKSDEDLKNTALSLPETKKWIEGKEVKKVIVVKGKPVSIVV